MHLILDCLGAGGLRANLRALAPDGHLIVIGLQQGARAELNLGLLLARRLRVSGSTLRALSDARKAALVERFEAEVWPQLDSGALRLTVDRRLAMQEPCTETHATERMLQDGFVDRNAFTAAHSEIESPITSVKTPHA